ncbi:MAG: hypothetical protein LBC70_04435 [Chitinispirillales bacterium]|jgi:TolB protein|nr:hypothetical protein [Chitinispirillales bacterium]
MKRVLVLFTLIFATAGVLAEGRFELEVYASQFDSIPIGVVNFTPTEGSAVLRENLPWEIIANNLDFTGRFNVVKSERFDSALFAEAGIAIYIDGQYTVEGSGVLIESNLREVATQSAILTRRYRGEARFLRNMVHRYCNELVEILFAERGFFESRILYVRNEGQRKNIAIMDFDGHNRSMLTNNNTINIFPVFIDKSNVLWTSYQRGKPDIYKGSITEGTSRIFLEGPAMLVSPDVSPIDGTVAYASSQHGTLNIFTSAPDGTRQRRLTFSRGIDTAPNWSPNGYQIAFTSDRAGGPQIYVMDAAGANQRRVTFEGRYNDTPAWSPRGDKIAYASRHEGQFTIWTVSPDGTNAEMVANPPGMNEYPTWSPDGSLIAFINTTGGRSDLYVVRPDGTRLRRVTTSGDIRMPRWSRF